MAYHRQAYVQIETRYDITKTASSINRIKEVSVSGEAGKIPMWVFAVDRVPTFDKILV